MQPIDRKIKNLEDELSLWSSVLTPYLGKLAEMDTEEFSSYLLGDGTEKDEVSAEFSLESFVVAYGRLQEVLLAGRSFWPQRRDTVEQMPHESEKIIAFIRAKAQGEEGLDWKTKLVLKRTENFDEILFHDHALELKDYFTMVHRWRRSLVKRTVLEVPHLAMGDLITAEEDKWGGHIVQQIQRLPSSDRQLFRNAVRRYLASDYLFPWLADQYHPHTLGYEGLFKVAQLEEQPMFKFDERFWDEIFGDIEIEQDTQEIVVNIMERIGGVLREIGSYDELVDQIIRSGGQWGRDSMVGSQDKVNLIPSDEPGQCQEILIAFARGRRSPKTGLGAVMRQVREHLIRCGDSSCSNAEPTRVAIIFTDLWDQNIFAESLGDLRAHHETFPGKVIIGALVNKDRITPQAII